MNDSQIPVIIGVGQLNDRPQNPLEGMDSLEMMAAALRLADADGGGGWLADCDSLAVVHQMSFPALNPIVDALADAIGAAPKHREETPMASGDSPILLLNEAANRIAAGEIRIAVVVGAEALRTAAARRKADAAAEAEAQKALDTIRAKINTADDAKSSDNVIRKSSTRPEPSYSQKYGLIAPVDIYPLYENACRAAWGQNLVEAQTESGLIWSLFSEVAARNPGAWINKAHSAEEILSPAEGNRPIAHPYNKLMVANMSVNQAAGFIVTSLAEARARGVPEDRIIYVGMGAAAHEAWSPIKRDCYDKTAGMTVSIRKAMELNGWSTDDLDAVELYSCFPCVPKMARRVLGWPAEKEASVFGGLTFGGGPIGNYMGHAVVSMILRLRSGGTNGLLFANGGYATHNHTIGLSSQPITAAHFPQDFHYQEEADAMRGSIPAIVEDYSGPATIETYTVFYERDGSARQGVVVARTPSGDRTLAKVEGHDTDMIAFLTDGVREPVGTSGHIEIGADATQIWRAA